MKTTKKTYSLDGTLIPSEQAFVSVNDLTFTRGYGAFDAMRTYERVPFLVEKHINRLLDTARHIKLKHPFDKKQIFSRIRQALSKNPTGEKLIRQFITAGDGAGLTVFGDPRIFIMVDDITPPPAHQVQEGVSLWPHCYVRPSPQAKSTNYTEAVFATLIAKEKKCDEAVFINNKGEFYEGTTFNIIAHTKSGWIIPNENILTGITLQTVISILKNAKEHIVYRNIKSSDIKKCLGLFITSSNREILAVKKIGEYCLPPAHEQIAYSFISQAYQKIVNSYTAKHKIIWQ